MTRINSINEGIKIQAFLSGLFSVCAFEGAKIPRFIFLWYMGYKFIDAFFVVTIGVNLLF